MKFDVESVLSFIRSASQIPLLKRIAEIDGHRVKLNTRTLLTFIKDGTTCRGCGIKGQYFIVELANGKSIYCLHLYGVDENGRPVLMTRDHIHPRSKGGSDGLYNMQTMCYKCNLAKGDKIYESRDTRQGVSENCQHEYALQYN